MPSSSALACAARLGAGAALLAGSLAAAPAWSVDAPGRGARLLWREAGAYLELTPAQREALEGLHAAHARRLQSLRDAEARRATAAGRTRPGDSPSAALCQQATEARPEWLAGSRALLTPLQLARLAQLEAAFALMPVIESAQAAGLLDDRMTLPPRRLPEGSVAQEVSWQRVPAAALPGCPAAATTVFPEVERKPPDASAEPPRR